MTHIKISDLTNWLNTEIAKTQIALGNDQSETDTAKLRGTLRAYRAVASHITDKPAEAQVGAEYDGVGLDPSAYFES